MAVRAIQSNENRYSSTSYVKAGAVGALSGYALKYLLPLTQAEKDAKYSNELDFKRFVKSKEIDALKNTKSKAAEVFTKMFNEKELTAGKINSYKEPLKTQIKNLIANINNKAREMKKTSYNFFKKLNEYNAYPEINIKEIRPAKKFAAIGAVVGIATAFVYNVLNGISDNKEK